MMLCRCLGYGHVHSNTNCGPLGTHSVPYCIDFSSPTVEGILTILAERVKCDPGPIKVHESYSRGVFERTWVEFLCQRAQRFYRLGYGISDLVLSGLRQPARHTMIGFCTLPEQAQLASEAEEQEAVVGGRN